MMDTAGAIIGSFLALLMVIFLFDILNDELGILKLILIFSALVSLTAVIPIFFLTEPKDRKNPELRKQVNLITSLKDLPRGYYKFLLISIIFGLANFTILLFIIHTKALLLDTNPNTSEISQLIFPILTFIWFNIVYTALSIPFGMWSDKYGRKKIFAVGIGLFILTCFGFAFTRNPLILFFFFGIYGAFNAATDGIQKAFAVDILPSDLKGTGIGLLQTSVGIAGILGGMFAGYLYDTLPYVNLPSSFAFLYGGILSGIALILLLATKMSFSNLIEK
jgi:MFS family permease